MRHERDLEIVAIEMPAVRREVKPHRQQVGHVLRVRLERVHARLFPRCIERGDDVAALDWRLRGARQALPAVLHDRCEELLARALGDELLHLLLVNRQVKHRPDLPHDRRGDPLEAGEDRRGEEACDGHVVGDGLIQESRGAEARDEDDRGARDQAAHHGVVLGVGVEEGQNGKDPVVGPDARGGLG